MENNGDFSVVGLSELYADAELMVHTEIERNSPKVKPEYIYDFFIDALGRELAASYTSRTFVEEVDAMQHLRLPDEYMRTGNQQNEKRIVRFPTVNMACVPWSHFKLAKALTDVAQNGYCRGTLDAACQGVLFDEMKLTVVYTAHHHAAAAQMTHDEMGTMQVQVISMQPFFETLRVDTSYQWCNAAGIPYTETLVDPRFAMMYELARRKYVLLKSKNSGYDEYLKETRLIKSTVSKTLSKEIISVADLPGLPFWKKLLLRLMKLYLCNGKLIKKP